MTECFCGKYVFVLHLVCAVDEDEVREDFYLSTYFAEAAIIGLLGSLLR